MYRIDYQQVKGSRYPSARKGIRPNAAAFGDDPDAWALSPVERQRILREFSSAMDCTYSERPEVSDDVWDYVDSWFEDEKPKMPTPEEIAVCWRERALARFWRCVRGFDFRRAFDALLDYFDGYPQ